MKAEELIKDLCDDATELGYEVASRSATKKDHKAVQESRKKLSDEFDRIVNERDRYRKALEDILDPIGEMQRRAEAEGSELRVDGISAVYLANNPTYLREIARKALNETSTTNHEQHGRGDEDGPYDPDCKCRGTENQKECAAAGCGFCKSAEVNP